MALGVRLNADRPERQEERQDQKRDQYIRARESARHVQSSHEQEREGKDDAAAATSRTTARGNGFTAPLETGA